MNARYLAAAIAVLLSANAGAEDKTNFSANAGVGYSDNLARTATDEQGESIYTTGVALDWERDGSRLDGKMAAGLDWYSYSGDLFDDELLGRVNGDLKFGFVPGRFDWVLVDTYGQIASDPLSPTTADNRQNVNALSTGPDLTARFGTATFLQLGGRYNDVRYQDSQADYDGWSATLALGRELSAASSVRIGATRDAIRYADTSQFTDYDRDQIFLSYQAKGARTELDASAGWSRVSRAGVDDTAPMLKLTVLRDVSSRSKLSFTGEYGLSTDGEIFSGMQGGASSGPRPDSTPGLGDYAARTSVGVDWGINWTRTNLNLGVFAGQEDYAASNGLDVKRSGAFARVGRQFSHKTSATLSGRVERRDYTAIGRDERDVECGLELRRQIAQSWAALLSVTHETRDSDVDTSDYVENKAMLRVTWAPSR